MVVGTDRTVSMRMERNASIAKTVGSKECKGKKMCEKFKTILPLVRIAGGMGGGNGLFWVRHAEANPFIQCITCYWTPYQLWCIAFNIQLQ